MWKRSHNPSLAGNPREMGPRIGEDGNQRKDPTAKGITMVTDGTRAQAL